MATVCFLGVDCYLHFPASLAVILEPRDWVLASECGWASQKLLPDFTLLNTFRDYSLLPLASQQGFWKPCVPGGLAQDARGPPNCCQDFPPDSGSVEHAGDTGQA